MATNIRILILEDMPSDAQLIEHELRKAGVAYTMKLVWTAKDFLKEMDSFKPDIILSDYSMPQFNALEALRLLRERQSDLPFILVTGSQTEEVAVECMKAGADDYILKQSLKRLPTAIQNVLRKTDAERERKQTESRLQTMIELENTRTMLTNMITHDLRNPLSAAMGYLQIMQSKSSSADVQMTGYMQKANEACHRLLEMVNQIVDVMRMEDRKMPVKTQKTDVAVLIRTKMQEYLGPAEANGLKMNALEPSSPIEAHIDPALIERVLENLITNAIKHTPRGGEITLGIDPPSADQKMFSLWVRDNGEGISPEYHGRLFQKYGQVEMQKRGRSYDTGLGLVFCRMAVELHGGEIHVASDVNQGSTFTVELPVKPDRPERK